jgi:predicted pyridoxine 5'-phosphate oxidase superfamily flavin-nucleotide-binding protein
MTDNRMSLFFMDYANKMRLKLFGHAEIVGLDDQKILPRLEMPDYRARVERGFLIKVEGFDWNCPQHITERFTLDAVRAIAEPLTARNAELEAELAPRPAPQSAE